MTSENSAAESFDELFSRGIRALRESHSLARQSAVKKRAAGRWLYMAQQQLPIGRKWRDCLSEAGISTTQDWEAQQLYLRAKSLSDEQLGEYSVTEIQKEKGITGKRKRTVPIETNGEPPKHPSAPMMTIPGVGEAGELSQHPTAPMNLPPNCPKPPQDEPEESAEGVPPNGAEPPKSGPQQPEEPDAVTVVVAVTNRLEYFRGHLQQHPDTANIRRKLEELENLVAELKGECGGQGSEVAA